MRSVCSLGVRSGSALSFLVLLNFPASQPVPCPCEHLPASAKRLHGKGGPGLRSWRTVPGRITEAGEAPSQPRPQSTRRLCELARRSRNSSVLGDTTETDGAANRETARTSGILVWTGSFLLRSGGQGREWIQRTLTSVGGASHGAAFPLCRAPLWKVTGTLESKHGEERTVLTPYFKHTYPLGIGNAVLSGVPGVLEDFSGETSSPRASGRSSPCRGSTALRIPPRPPSAVPLPGVRVIDSLEIKVILFSGRQIYRILWKDGIRFLQCLVDLTSEIIWARHCVSGKLMSTSLFFSSLE